MCPFLDLINVCYIVLSGFVDYVIRRLKIISINIFCT